MSANSDEQQLRDAIKEFAERPGQAIDQIRPLADAGNHKAAALVAYFYAQQGKGKIDEALPYAEQAIQHGYGHLAQLYAVDLAQRQRPELRSRAPEFAQAALDDGVDVDLFDLAIKSAKNGEPLFSDLLDGHTGPGPSGVRDRWEKLLAQAKIGAESIDAVATEVKGRRDQALKEIGAEADAVAERRADAERQADELGLVTSALASHNLADAYAKDAERTETQARRYTTASLAIGLISAIISAAALFTLREGSGLDTTLTHAAFGLPLALLAAYVNKLASTHRREAWRLRHIELQIRTANPFLGLLDAERRRETLSNLALRFFPGQENFLSHDGDEQPPTLELIDALRALLREQQPKATADQVSAPQGKAA